MTPSLYIPVGVGVGVAWLIGLAGWYGRPLLRAWRRAGKVDDVWHDTRGSVLVEAAFIFPIFLLLVLGAFDLLWAETTRANVAFLAQQAAVCLERSGCDAAAYIAGNAAMVGLDPAKLSAVVTKTTVRIEYRYDPVGPDFPHITLRAVAVIP